jgi:hypothetical protein
MVPVQTVLFASKSVVQDQLPTIIPAIDSFLKILVWFYVNSPVDSFCNNPTADPSSLTSPLRWSYGPETEGRRLV